MNREHFTKVFGKGRWAALWPRLEAVARPAVQLIFENKDGEPERSHAGGPPAVGMNGAWPTDPEGHPMQHLLSLRISELPDLDTVFPAFPKVGWLSVFYQASKEVWGIQPEDKGYGCICFSPVEVCNLLIPPSEDLLPCKAVSFAEILSFPGVDHPVLKNLIPVSLEDDYIELTDPGMLHQLGGYARAIHEEMEMECALVALGQDLSEERFSPLLEKQAQQEASAWRLFLQLDTQSDVGLVWPDYGRWYAWMKADSIRAHSFQDAWMMIQAF